MTPTFGKPIVNDENWMYEVKRFVPESAKVNGQYWQVAAGTVKAANMTDARNAAFEQLAPEYQNYLTSPTDSKYYELLLFSLE